mmetsp:Transcript_52224/g.111186  ORF Transcript_52224/g.111186 Transcript_52224/m.111186 type:complete len:113 (+) Transcript_52224:567-905(+)
MSAGLAAQGRKHHIPIALQLQTCVEKCPSFQRDCSEHNCFVTPELSTGTPQNTSHSSTSRILIGQSNVDNFEVTFQAVACEAERPRIGGHSSKYDLLIILMCRTGILEDYPT